MPELFPEAAKRPPQPALKRASRGSVGEVAMIPVREGAGAGAGGENDAGEELGEKGQGADKDEENGKIGEGGQSEPSKVEDVMVGEVKV